MSIILFIIILTQKNHQKYSCLFIIYQKFSLFICVCYEFQQLPFTNWVEKSTEGVPKKESNRLTQWKANTILLLFQISIQFRALDFINFIIKKIKEFTGIKNTLDRAHGKQFHKSI